MRGGNEEQEKPDLLVFGYACKLFRDDEKAIVIESGQHLIPWMGDESLKIDRYDGRGALYDLKSLESKEDYKEEMSVEDIALEQLCNEERYRSLYINEEEDITYREEASKRTQHQSQGYGEVEYNYDVPNCPNEESNQGESVPNRPFVPPPELNVPADMKVPETAKHNAIIERTALFLAQQGSQMEILMKVKQQDNKNFDFLSHADPLHDYYKHLKELIKTGNYVPKEHELDEEGAMADESNEHYLHPSLVTKISGSHTSTPSPPAGDKSKGKVDPAQPEHNCPPDYVQKIIEKMVKYVIKNGLRFETAIMKRGDVRFSFLNPKNPYNPFYKKQLETYRKLTAPKPMKTVKTVVDSDPPDESTKDCRSMKRKPLPVCFSIKKPKESESLEVLSALPVEESSEEDSNNPTSPKPNESDSERSSSLEKRIKKSTEVTKKHKYRKDADLQNERKMKVAQFLKGLKKK